MNYNDLLFLLLVLLVLLMQVIFVSYESENRYVSYDMLDSRAQMFH